MQSQPARPFSKRSPTFQKDNKMKNINNVPAVLIGLIFVIILFSFVLGCDPAKLQNPSSSYQNPEKPTIEENNEAVDTSIELDQTFEDEEYGFRFNYPGTLSLEHRGQSEEIPATEKILVLWFLKPKIDQEMVAMRIRRTINNQQISKTETQITQEIKKEDGLLELFEKIKLDNQDCIHIKVAFKGLFDPRGDRVSEQYFLEVKQHDLMINFSAPADKFETYRPQFIAILNSFKIDN
jgi:hypothetical protein